jgi:hypothetical protein
MAAAFAAVAKPGVAPSATLEPRPPVATKPVEVTPPAPVSRPMKPTLGAAKVVPTPAKPAVVPVRPPAPAFGTARIKVGKRAEAVW